MLVNYSAAFLVITQPASILHLDLEHLHGCGDSDLAHSCTASGQHLFEHRQLAPDDENTRFRMKVKNPRMTGLQ